MLEAWHVVVVQMLRISRSMDHMRLKIDDCCGRSLTGGNRFDGLVKLDTIVDSEMSSIHSERDVPKAVPPLLL